MKTMASSMAIPMATEGNLSRYLQDIRKFPMLSAEEELSLALRWRDNADEPAAHKLVTFDPDRGFRLATYAMWWIRAAIQEYILHSWSLVKMGTTAAQKKLFFNLRRLKAQMSALEEGDLQPEQVAKISHVLQVPEQDVISMNRRLAGADNSLNAPLRADGEGEWQDWLVDESENQEQELAEHQDMSNRRELLSGALKTLNERERHILIERRLKEEPTTLEELSQQYNISRERVRQIEVRAFEKLQKSMKQQIMDRRLTIG